MSPQRQYHLPRWLRPHYDDLSLFLMSVALLLLFFDPVFRRVTIEFVFSDRDVRRYLCLLVYSAGLIMSLCHVFASGPKTSLQKTLMLIFAVITNGFSGIAAGMAMMEGAKGILVVFPIWNIVCGALLLILFRFNIIDETSIEDNQSSLLQVVFGVVVLGVAFALCQVVFRLHWAITYSICIAYSTTLNDTLQRLFPALGRTGGGEGAHGN